MQNYSPRNAPPARGGLTDPRSSAPARGGQPKPLNDRRSTRDPRST